MFLGYLALDKLLVKLSGNSGACSDCAIMESEVSYQIMASLCSP